MSLPEEIIPNAPWQCWWNGGLGLQCVMLTCEEWLPGARPWWRRAGALPFISGVTLTLLAACGGGESATPATSTGTSIATPSAATAMATAATPVATLTGAAAAIADINARAKATPPAAEVLQAMREAARIHSARVAPDCMAGEACVAAENLAPYDHGVMRLGITDGMGGAILIMGKDRSGAWKEWFGTQNITYRLLELPGDMLVCADGDSLNVRVEPDPTAKVVGLLPPLGRVTAEQFVLTEPATLTPGSGQVVGSGWYRLSSPQVGWASSRFLSDARLKDCTIRDQTEKR